MINVDAKKEIQKIALVFGAIMTSVGLQGYIPPDVGPASLVVGGIVLSYIAIRRW